MLKKCILILLGIVLSLLVLESGLRLAGFIISSYQQYRNSKALKNNSQYIVMCLGESLTQYQYPVQLQEILDKKYPNKFSIIDCGIAGTNLKAILKFINTNIDKYHPNIAICMMGCNELIDTTSNTKYNNINKIKQFKIYKFLVIIRNLFLSKNNVANKKLEYKNNKQIDDINDYKNKQQFDKVEQILLEKIENNPNDEEIYAELVALYYGSGVNRKLGYEMAINALDKKYKLKKEEYYKTIFESNYNCNNIELLKYYANMALNNDIEIFSTKYKYWLYGVIKDYITQEEKEKIFKIMIKDNDEDYGILAVEAIRNKEYKKAEEYFNKAEEIRLKCQNNRAYNLYKLIVQKLIQNNIKVICMQYPMRSVNPIKEQLRYTNYYNKITFISNEKKFKDALLQNDFNEIFRDQSHGDFGHCTTLGNTIIAENVAETLEKLLE